MPPMLPKWFERKNPLLDRAEFEERKNGVVRGIGVMLKDFWAAAHAPSEQSGLRWLERANPLLDEDVFNDTLAELPDDQAEVLNHLRQAAEASWHGGLEVQEAGDWAIPAKITHVEANCAEEDRRLSHECPSDEREPNVVGEDCGLLSFTDAVMVGGDALVAQFSGEFRGVKYFGDAKGLVQESCPPSPSWFDQASVAVGQVEVRTSVPIGLGDQVSNPQRSCARKAVEISGAEITDAEIIRGLIARREEALGMLLDKHGRGVWGRLVRYLGGRADLVDDAMSRALQHVWDYPWKLRRLDNLGGFFFEVTRRKAWYLQRRDLTQMALIPESNLDIDLEAVLAERMHPASIGQRKLIEDLRGCVDLLGEMQRHIVLQDLVCGGSAPARPIAWLFKTSESSVYQSRHRAYRKLRELLERCGHRLDVRESE